jgi:hypothetical protein
MDWGQESESGHGYLRVGESVFFATGNDWGVSRRETIGECFGDLLGVPFSQFSPPKEVLAGAKPRWASLVPMHQGKKFLSTNYAQNYHII